MTIEKLTGKQAKLAKLESFIEDETGLTPFYFQNLTAYLLNNFDNLDTETPFIFGNNDNPAQRAFHDYFVLLMGGDL